MNIPNIVEINKKEIKAVFADFDGTLTHGQRLRASTLGALERLSQSGYLLAIVSGRPAGWADCLMRLAPIDAMVFENGAGIVTREGKRLNVTPVAEKQPNTSYLLETFERLKKIVPELKLSSDQFCRRFDVAIDFAEEPPFLSEEQVQMVLSELEADPAIVAKLSSIHINYWMGSYTKLSASKRMIEMFCENEPLEKEEIIFVGDSPNDEPMFGYFPKSVGVSNVSSYLTAMKQHPKYVTKNAEGTGFEELANWLCQG